MVRNNGFTELSYSDFNNMRYLLIIFSVTSYLGANDFYNLESRFQPVLSTNFFFLNQDSLPAGSEMVEKEDLRRCKERTRYELINPTKK